MDANDENNNSGIVQTRSWKFISFVPQQAVYAFLNKQLFTWRQYVFFFFYQPNCKAYLILRLAL